jgi:hypothetical protein
MNRQFLKTDKIHSAWSSNCCNFVDYVCSKLKGNAHALSSINDGARSKDYQQYLDETVYDGTLPTAKIAVDI